MKVLIIEDEPQAAQRIETLMRKLMPGVGRGRQNRFCIEVSRMD